MQHILEKLDSKMRAPPMARVRGFMTFMLAVLLPYCFSALWFFSVCQNPGLGEQRYFRTVLKKRWAQRDSFEKVEQRIASSGSGVKMTWVQMPAPTDGLGPNIEPRYPHHSV